MRMLILVPAVLALLALSSSTGVQASPGVTTRVSVASDGTQANGFSQEPAISADARFVAFYSYADNLVAGDINSSFDVFVRDRQAGTTERISVDSGGNQASSHSLSPTISADGRFVAFYSYADNLVAGDTNNFCDLDEDGVYNENCVDVFVRDRQAGTTERVSVDSGGNQASSHSLSPTISADGRFVAFWSFADNVVDGDTNNFCDLDQDGVYNENCVDVFVRDRQAGTTERVSVSSIGAQANSDSAFPAISADGRFVAFHSSASNLVADDSNTCGFGGPGTCPDVFVHDRQTGATTRVSVDSSGAEANDGSQNSAISISADGRLVAFGSDASNLVDGDTNSSNDVFVHDRQTGETTRLSMNSGGDEANYGGYDAAISADGRFVAFESRASNLVDGDTNDNWDVFVHDRQTGMTTRVSFSSGGDQANAGSSESAVSADGRFVAFGSDASNLLSGDTNGLPDVFVHDLGDLDGDGELDPFDPCPTSADHTDSDGDLKPDACDGPGSGNVDCSPPPNGVTAVDALKVLRHSAGLSVLQNEPCLNIGQPRALTPPFDWKVGDVDCSGVVNSVDALKILRAVAGLSVVKPVECPEVKPA
jgi:hypothetical protein